MKTIRALVLLSFFWSGLASAALLSPGHYKVDPTGSEAAFNVTNFLITSVDGHFKTFDGEVLIGDRFEDSRVQATIEVRSLDTENEKRDEHLRSPDFFEAEKYPTMTFKSSHLTGDETHFKLSGTLTVKGVSKEVTLDCRTETTPDGTPRILANTEINRQDFGITSGGSIKNTVRLKLRINLRRATSPSLSAAQKL